MKTLPLISLLFFGLAFMTKGQNNPPVAVNDTITGIMGYPAYVNLLKNDYDPDGDSFYCYRSNGMRKLNDSTWKVRLDSALQYNEYDTILFYSYIIRDEHGATAKANVVVKLRAVAKYEFLDVNNLNALISPFGNHFWDLENSRFEVPKGSGKYAIFNHTVRVAGLDSTSMLHVAAEKYRYSGADFYIGPVSAVYDTSYKLKWNRLWKLDKVQIRHHIKNWSSPGYVPIDAIANWPAQGDPDLGQTADIAPYYDANLDGQYTPMAGDYPLIRGDQAVFFILNDARYPHTESYGLSLGIEIRGMAYAFDRPNDSTLNNTMFFHYDITNLSANNYHDTFIGLFADFDLGHPIDDYYGSDVTNGMVYAYNGDSIDGDGLSGTYGEHPPAIGMKVIGGPILQPDGIDNPANNCDEGLNGLNFGDGIPDNERMGLTRSSSRRVVSIGCPGYGSGYFQPYEEMRNSVFYGSNGYLNLCDTTPTGEGPYCNFIFPGNSDTICNWGTLGIPPNAGYNQNGYYWTEKSVGNVPQELRGVGSAGPFNFNAGQSVPLDYCFTWARDYTGDNNSSVELLRQRVSELKPFFSDLITVPVTYYGTSEYPAEKSLKIYPNPVHNKASVTLDGNESLLYHLYTVNGKLVSTGKLQPGTTIIELSFLTPGIYLFNCGNRHVKLVKL